MSHLVDATDVGAILQENAPARFKPAPIPPAPPVAGLIRASLVAVGVFVGGGFAWAALAPLSSAAIAPGTVKVETSKQTVQHLEGGIIRDILVREGELVTRGQVLMRLDDGDAGSDRNAVQGQIDALSAREARLIAQRDGTKDIVFPRELLRRRMESAVDQVMVGQSRIFADQMNSVQGEIDILLRRVEQYRAQMTSIHAQISVTRQQLPKLEEELRDVRSLFAKGLGLKPRVLDLERRVMAAKGDILANEGRVSSLSEQVREAEAQIESVRRKSAREVSEELRDVQTRLVEARESFSKAEAKAGRREVLSPHEGVVMNLKYTTPGGVVPPGGVILDLVPREEKLVMEVRISPLDIDVVRPGLPAKIRLVAFKQRTTPVLDGSLVRVSPDAVIDEKTGAGHFVAVVEAQASLHHKGQGRRLYPGMPVEVSIVTGERSVLDYIIQPFTDSLARAFREE